MIDKLIAEAKEQATWDIPESTQQLLLQLAEVAEKSNGYWIKFVDECDCEYIECSCCGNDFYDGNNDTYDILPNYCCECGTKMSNGGR